MDRLERASLGTNVAHGCGIKNKLADFAAGREGDDNCMRTGDVLKGKWLEHPLHAAIDHHDQVRAHVGEANLPSRMETEPETAPSRMEKRSTHPG